MDSTDSSRKTENFADVKDRLAGASEEKIYEYFSLQAWDLKEVVDSFECLKEKFGLSKKSGLEVYRGFRSTLGSSGSKVWKAKNVLDMLEKRAAQKEYMQQVGVVKCGGGRGQVCG